MAEFTQSGITNAGKELLAKVQINQAAVNFTKMAAGRGEIPAEQTVQTTTELYDKVMDLEIVKLQINQNSTVTVGSVLNNIGLTEGFEFRELGLYAEDPDLGEILYSYGNAEDAYDFIPPEISGTIEQLLDIITSVGEAEVTAVINSGIYATHEDLDALHSEINEDLNNKLDKTGDASNTNVIFTENTSFLDINSGEKQSVLFGKLKKWYDEIGLKLNKTGDASNVVNNFTQSTSRSNLTSGEKLSVSLGKLMKWFADLKPVAWSGNAADLADSNAHANIGSAANERQNTINTKIDTELGTKVDRSIEIHDGADLNDYQIEGFYFSRSDGNVIENVPVSGRAFALLVERFTEDGWKQTWTSYRTDLPTAMYIRNSYNNTWGEWYKVLVGEELTGSFTIPHGTNIRGTGSGSANTVLLEFMEGDNVTRRGYIGDSSGSNDMFAIVSEKGDLNLAATTGNEVLINGYTAWHKGNAGIIVDDKMIGYDDTIHATTPLQDILRDLFGKSQELVGNDKPFQLTFLIGNAITTNSNFFNKLIDFIEMEYGFTIPANAYFMFKMETTTNNGTNNYTFVSGSKCSIWSNQNYFEFNFDYDNWANVIVRDAAGQTRPLSEQREQLLKSHYVGMYMHSGQTETITIPTNCHVTNLEFTFSDYDADTSEIQFFQFDTATLSDGDIYNSDGAKYNNLTSGMIDIMKLLTTTGEATTFTQLTTKVIGIQLDYSANELRLWGDSPDTTASRDVVLNSVNIFGYYL